MQGCVKRIQFQDMLPDAQLRCNEPAVIIDKEGRPLCKKHYNQWVRKYNKRQGGNVKYTPLTGNPEPIE